MLDLTAYGRLAKLTKLADRMINDASHETIVTAARILALQLAHCQHLHGESPMDAAVDLLASTGLEEHQAHHMADSLELLAMALATVRDDVPASLDRSSL